MSTISDPAWWMKGRKTCRLWLVILALVLPAGAVADAERPRLSPPEGLAGLPVASLMPPQSWRFSLGSAQTRRAAFEGQTGRQVYVGTVSRRLDGPWQVGLSLTGFDDLPAQPVQGRGDDVTDLGLGTTLTYQLQDRPRFHLALQAGAEARYFSRGQRILHQGDVAKADRAVFATGMIGLVSSLQAAARLWLHGGVGYTYAPAELAGDVGFGARGHVKAGLSWHARDRLWLYGAIGALAAGRPYGIDAPARASIPAIYSFGGGLALTPQSLLNLYITNAYSRTPIGDDFLFYPDLGAPVLGAALHYTPGARDAAWPSSLAFADQSTLSLSMGSAGGARVTLAHAPEPDLRFALSVAAIELSGVDGFREPWQEDARLGLAIGWQSLRQDRDASFDLGTSLAVSRDLADPSIGVMFAEAELHRGFNGGAIGLTARRAAFGPDFGEKPEPQSLWGLAVTAEHALSNRDRLLGEVGLAGEGAGIWQIGVQRDIAAPPLTVDVIVTNAAGSDGIATLLQRNRPQLLMQLHWQWPRGAP